MKLKQVHCASETTCSTIPLEPRKIIKKSIGKLFLIIIWIIVMSWFTATMPEEFINAIIESGWWRFTYLSISLILIFGIIFYQFLYYRYYFYDLTSEEVIIMKGVVSRKRILVRYEKIQNIFIDQDFLDRILKLYDVHIATADPQSALASHIDGISKENAEKLKEILTENIKSRRAESGV